MSHSLASDASLASMVEALSRELRRHKRAVREHRQQMRLIRSRLASARAECQKRGIIAHDAR